LALEIVSDSENKLLQRRELECLFKGLSGTVTRSSAVETVASQLKVNPKTLHLVRISSSAGTRDARVLLYVYGDESTAKKHVPRHLFVRALPKEERQKAKGTEKAPTVKAPAAKAPTAPAKPKA